MANCNQNELMKLTKKELVQRLIDEAEELKLIRDAFRNPKTKQLRYVDGEFMSYQSIFKEGYEEGYEEASNEFKEEINNLKTIIANEVVIKEKLQIQKEETNKLIEEYEEENKDFKEQIFGIKCDDMKIEGLVEQVIRLGDENEKQKQEIEELKEENKLLHDIGRDATGQALHIKFIKEENEELKEEIEELKTINELNNLLLEYTEADEFLDTEEFVEWLKEHHNEEKVNKFKTLMNYESDDEE